MELNNNEAIFDLEKRVSVITLGDIFTDAPNQIIGSQVWCVRTELPAAAASGGGNGDGDGSDDPSATTSYITVSSCQTVYRSVAPSITVPTVFTKASATGRLARTTSFLVESNPSYVAPTPTSSSSWNPATDVNTWTDAPTAGASVQASGAASSVLLRQQPHLLVPVLVACGTAMLFWRRVVR